MTPAVNSKHHADLQMTVDLSFMHGGNAVQASDAAGVVRETFVSRLRRAKQMGMTPSPGIKPMTGGQDHIFAMREETLPAAGKVKSYILTSAQNNTKVNATVWAGLRRYAKHTGAQILVSRYMYNKAGFNNPKLTKPGTQQASDTDDLWYDPAVVPFISDERVILAPGLAWCGEVHIRPTAVDPLSGLEAYTGRLSGIFPHAKIAMRSIASGKREATKFNYTTGTVTQRNYIQRKEGLKAEFHHSYGAAFVEIDSDGNWWVRQLNADKTSTFYDLDVKVQGDKLTTAHPAEAVTWGDVHVAQIDPTNREVCWGKGGLLDTLRPKHQVFHDVLDMQSRGHHNMKDPHVMFALHVQGKESVRNEVGDVANFLKFTRRPWSKDYVANSNHHDHLLRWLKEADWRKDMVNAEFYAEAQCAVLKSIRAGDKGFDILRWAVERSGGIKGLTFLGEDESFITCKRHGDGIENGMHGHLGPNGTRPSPKAFTKMGRKANIGHSHTAGIYDGVYVAGTSSQFDLGYNKGPSSWSHSHILTYANGKRAIVTVWNGKWRASRPPSKALSPRRRRATVAR